MLPSGRVSEFTLPSSIVLRGALAFAAVSATVCAAVAQERGHLVGVQAGGDAATASVELIGDRPLSFTTLKLREPPRVVVDFAETDLSVAPREVTVGDGTILRVAAAAAGQKTARVVIELAGDADFEVRASGNSVEVRVPRIAPLLAKADAPPAAGPAGEAAAAEAKPQAAPEAATAPEPEKPAEPGAQTEAEKRASLPKVALVGSRLAAAPTVPAERTGAARKAVANGTRRTVVEKRRTAATAAGERRARAAPSQRKLAAAEARHSITGIGFRPVGDGAVIVHGNQPLEYAVSSEDGAILLHLPGAAIPLPNNRRELDTHFFNGPVQRVVPLAVAGGTDLRIELRGHPGYQLAQSGSTLTVTFSVPR